MAEPAIPHDPDRRIVTVRDIDAPRETVFSAWSEPEHLKVWWGPHGFTNTFDVFDFRPGGYWKFTMHGPEKGHYRNEVEFIAISPPECIHWKRHSQPYFQIYATFAALSGHRTRVTFQMLFDTPEECAKLRPYVVDKNEENMDRLEAQIAQMVKSR